MIEWSNNTWLAHSIMTSPNIWPHISDDTCDKDSFVLPDIDGKIFRLALCYHNHKLYGCFYFIEKDEQTTEIHTCMMIAGKAKEFGDQIVKKVFDETDYEKIETFIPEDNQAARKLAQRCGFVFAGMKKPIIKSRIETPVEAWELKKCLQQ